MISFSSQHGENLGRDEFIRAVTHLAETDPRIHALWLEGSLGRGHADRYSDVDFHVLLSEKDLTDFKAGAEAWFSQPEAQVLFNALFGGAMLNGMTARGLRWDCWPHAGESIELNVGQALVLHARPDAVKWKEAHSPTPHDTGKKLANLIREFWRCISLLPAVLGRNERVVAMQGLMVEVGLLTEMLMLANGKVRDRGVKNLNAYLPGTARTQLEDAVLPTDFTLQALADAHLRLATWVKRDGRTWAAQHQITYPSELERTVLNVVQAELKSMNLQVNLWNL